MITEICPHHRQEFVCWECMPLVKEKVMGEKRCKTCRFWIPNPIIENQKRRGICSCSTACLSVKEYRGTTQSFGCIHWQQREPDLREGLAMCVHKMWSDWVNALFGFGKCSENGTVIITSGHKTVMERVANTEYANLATFKQNTFRKDADEIIAIVEKCQQKGDSCKH